MTSSGGMRVWIQTYETTDNGTILKETTWQIGSLEKEDNSRVNKI